MGTLLRDLLQAADTGHIHFKPSLEFFRGYKKFRIQLQLYSKTASLIRLLQLFTNLKLQAIGPYLNVFKLNSGCRPLYFLPRFCRYTRKALFQAAKVQGLLSPKRLGLFYKKRRKYVIKHLRSSSLLEGKAKRNSYFFRPKQKSFWACNKSSYCQKSEQFTFLVTLGLCAFLFMV